MVGLPGPEERGSVDTARGAGNEDLVKQLVFIYEQNHPVDITEANVQDVHHLWPFF